MTGRRNQLLAAAVAAATISLAGCFGGGSSSTTSTGATGPQTGKAPCPQDLQSGKKQFCAREIPPPPKAADQAGVAPRNAQPGEQFKLAPLTLAQGGNGQLSSDQISSATGCTVGLANTAAAAWNHVAVIVHQHTGYWLQSNGSVSCYRTYAQQVDLRNYWCNAGNCANAAVPGTSNHGWGLAVDAPPATVSYIHQYSGGLFGQGYGSCSDAPWESWHIKYCGGYSGSDPGPYGNGGGGGGGGGPAPCPAHPTLKRGDRCHHAVKHAQRRLRAWNQGLVRPAPDGSFGKLTTKATKQFQRVHDLGHDGVIGQATWGKLENSRVLKDHEQGNVNHIKLAWSQGRSGAGIRKQRRWCGRRAHHLVRVAGQIGWGNHRLQRVHALQAVDLRKGT